MTPDEARDRIALAADLPLTEACALYARISPWVGYLKVGLSLYVEHGPAAVRAFTSKGARVFLDLKLHDIPNTVRLASMRAGELGVSLLTVHAQGGSEMLRAAVEGVREGAKKANVAPPRVLAVTVLTSLKDEDVERMGSSRSASEQAAHLAHFACDAGVDGLVCSPREALALRESLKRRLFLCTPGIRPSGAELGDQARAETPAFAIRAGSDLLVAGRPIYGAPDPLEAARALHAEVFSA
jgi:orotidine-5'-phosphate decarboxylase